jgi:hypothetical protein
MESKYSGFWLRGANPGEQNKSRIYPESALLIWNTMPFNWASICHMAHGDYSAIN